MLLELAISAGFKYTKEMIVDNNLSRSVQHPRHRLIPGSYTDDTQISISIAIAANKPAEIPYCQASDETK